MAPLHRWKLSTLAAAAAICLGWHPPEASALALGRLTVQSALGEPLRAEIDIPQISPAEADTLRAHLGSAEQFKLQGLEFPSALNGLQIQVQRRVGNQAVLQLSTDRSVTEPFLDLVLDAQWQSGRLVRSYTLLLDPPATKRPSSTVRLAPQIAPPPAPPTSALTEPSTPPATGRTGATSAVVAPAASSTTSASTNASTAAGIVTVQPGQTASQIANQHRLTGVSLDQMLLAMLQGNPQAFIGGDVNRIKAGSPVRLPDAATAQATPQEQARQALMARSADFNAYRRELAALAPVAAVSPPGRTAAGAVQTRVEEKKAALPSADKLMLSRSGIGDPGAPEAQLAREKQVREAKAHVETLSQNIAALNQAQGRVGSNAVSQPTEVRVPTPPAASDSQAGIPPPAAPSVPGTAPISSGTGESGAQPPANTDAPAETSLAPAVAPPPSAPASVVAPAGVPALPPASASDPWSGNPLVPFAAGGLSALLLSYGIFRYLQARQARALDANGFLQASQLASLTVAPSVATEPRLDIQETSETPATPEIPAADQTTPIATLPSPLAGPLTAPEHALANDSVDPVAEADVYLAYGREQQAEDILNDALRRTPRRTAIHAKLAEIYATRQDRQALQRLQAEVFSVSNGQGADWERIVALVQSLEPQDPSYRSLSTSATASTASTPPLPIASAPTESAPSRAEGLATTTVQETQANQDPGTAGSAENDGLPPMEFDFDLASSPLPSRAAHSAPENTSPSEPVPGEGTPLASETRQSPLARMGLPTLDLVQQDGSPAAAHAGAEPVSVQTPPLAGAAPEPIDLALPADASMPLREPETIESAPEGVALDFTPMDFPSAPAAPVAPEIPATPATPADTSASRSAEMVLPREVRAPLELDLQSLALELNNLSTPLATPPVPEPRLQTAPPADRLATKLALAQEFQAIGDIDGTRSLLQEVAAEAVGELQARAQQMLAELA